MFVRKFLFLNLGTLARFGSDFLTTRMKATGNGPIPQQLHAPNSQNGDEVNQMAVGEKIVVQSIKVGTENGTMLDVAQSILSSAKLVQQLINSVRFSHLNLNIKDLAIN